MKPAAFEYHAPSTLDEALTLLEEHGDEAKPLAGGQSLIPAMNFRLAQPAVLVDLGRIDALTGLREDGAGVAGGAMTRQLHVERSPLIAERDPLLHQTVPLIAHPQIRNQGTFGGSLAHADPASELPAAALALGATMVLRSVRGEREVAADGFFQALFETALGTGELLTAVKLPATAKNTGTAFHELSRRHGDYALVGVAATVTLGADGRVAAARLVYMSVGEIPVDASAASASLVGEAPDEERLREAARHAAAREIDPPTDIHATTAYRRRLAEVLGFRALREAASRATGRT
jgi:carbon-monoxide dehydrogenase medium subunit